MIYYKSLTREMNKNCGYYSIILFDFNHTLLALELSNLFRSKPVKKKDNFYFKMDPNKSWNEGIIDLIEITDDMFVLNIMKTGGFHIDRFMYDLMTKINAKDFILFNFKKLVMSCRCTENFRYKYKLDSLLDTPSYTRLKEGNYLFSTLSKYHSKLFNSSQVLYERERLEGTMKTKFLIKEIEKVCK